MTLRNDLIQGKYVLGSKSVVGDPRRKWEDRVYVVEIHRSIGDDLVVGVVADGVGSADFGARGAQLAIDTVLATIEESIGNDIPNLIETSIQSANSAVYRDNQLHIGDGLTTLVIAVVCNDRCFVGNVGDSRVYWVPQSKTGRPRQVFQITRDHSYYNIYGGDRNSEEANILVNVIGNKPRVDVDGGVYLRRNNNGTGDIDVAYRLGLSGIPLIPGDTILLCSDGLVKEDPSGKPYIRDHEILEAIQSEYLPDRAAIKIISSAESRRPDDNVSAVTIQYISQELTNSVRLRTKVVFRLGNPAKIFLGVLIFTVVFVLGFLLGLQMR